MAFSITGILNRLTRPGFYALGSYMPEVDVQVRGYAARRGTREKALKKKRALKMKRAAQAAVLEKRKHVSTAALGIKRTVDRALPPIPEHIDVFISKLHKQKEYSIAEAVACHKENFHPTILDIKKAKIKVFLELNVTAEKQTKLLSPWKKLLSYPHKFEMGFTKRVLVLCQDSLANTAKDAGADLVGGSALVKDIKRGDIDLTMYDRVIGQLSFLDEISVIRSKLKLLMPRVQDGSLTDDVINAIPVFKYGVEYACNVSATEHGFGWVETEIGNSDMEAEEVEENFIALVKDINLKRPKREGDFITCGYCTAAPSREKFRISVDLYLNKLAEEESTKEKVAKSSASSAEEAVAQS